MKYDRRAVVYVAGMLFALTSVAAGAPAGEFAALGLQAGAISAAIGNQDMGKAAEGLDGIFSGSGLKKDSSDTVPVAAGAWRIAPRLEPAAIRPRVSSRRDVPAGLIVLRDDRGNQGAKFSNASAQGDLLEEARKRAEAILREAERAAREIAERDRTEAAKKRYGGCRMNNTCPR